MSQSMNIKELYYEADTRKHQQLVAERMIACAQRILKKAVVHDASKFSDEEKKHYIDPVWELSQGNVEYGSDQYKELTAQMGDGLAHHLAHNDHHPEFFNQFAVQTLNDPIRAMDLFALMEMLCDWIGASKRKENSPWKAFDYFEKKFNVDEQLMAVLRNTMGIIERLDK